MGDLLCYNGTGESKTERCNPTNMEGGALRRLTNASWAPSQRGGLAGARPSIFVPVFRLVRDMKNDHAVGR